MGDHGHGQRLCWVFGRILESNLFGWRRRGEKGCMGENLPEGSEEDEQAIGSSEDHTPYGTSPDTDTATRYIGLISNQQI